MRAKYWLSDACKLILMLLLGASVFFVMMLVQQASETIGDYLTEFTLFYVFMGSIVQTVILQVSFKLQIPLTLSMGCTRKEAHLGYQLYRLTFIVLALGLYSILSHLPGCSLRLSIFFLLGLYLFLGAIGSGLGLLSVKLGKKAMIIFLVIFGLLCGILGGLIGAGVMEQIPVSHGPVPFLALALGVLCHMLMVIPETKSIQTLVVKL